MPPRPTTDEIRRKRVEAPCREDAGTPLRRSHTSPAIHQVYAEFLGVPDGHLSHELLHTRYTARARA